MSFLGGSTVRTITPRTILKRTGDDHYLPGPLILDAGTSTFRRSIDGKNTGYTNELRAGCIMAQVTASKKWVPCKLTTVVAGGSGSGSGAGSTVVPVEDARFFVVGESVSIQPFETGKTPSRVTRTITSIDYENDLITVSGNPLQISTGTTVYVTTFSDSTTSAAGCEIPRAVLSKGVHTLNLDDLHDTALYDKPIQLLYRGTVNTSYILGDYAACRNATPNYLSDVLWSDRIQAA